MKWHGRVIIHGPKGILLVAKHGHPFNFPGGKRKRGENDLEAARRERRQEIGKHVKLSRLRFHSDHYLVRRGGGNDTRERHRIYEATLRPNGPPEPRHEIDKMKWVNRKNLARTKLAFPADHIVPKLFEPKGK